MSMINVNKTKDLFKHSEIFASNKTIEDYLLNIKELFESKDNQIQKLIAENEQLKDENYKDNELISMKEQMESAKADREAMRKDMYRGFPITEEEIKAIYDWSKEHDKKEHKNPRSYHGAIGGGFDYVFTPTSIGTIGICVCGTCQKRAYTEAFANGAFDKEKYNKYMNEHDGQFIFQDI